jgi:hypothetical protein
MKTFIASLLFFIPITLLGQNKDTTNKGPWTHTLVASLNLSQASYSNWKAGGTSTLAYEALICGKSEDNTPSFTWSNTYKFEFGQARLGNQSLRKTDDEIDFESLLKYKTDSSINPYAAVTFKSQFAEGFTYDNNDSATEVSKFLDPAYITQSVGALYTPNNIFKTRLGLALREVVTSKFTVYATDPSTGKSEKYLVEGGFESVSEIAYPIDDHVLLNANLTLFSPLKHMNRTILRSEDGLTVKVSKYITVNLNATFINDVEISPRTQIKQTLSLGFVYALL